MVGALPVPVTVAVPLVGFVSTVQIKVLSGVSESVAFNSSFVQLKVESSSAVLVKGPSP